MRVCVCVTGGWHSYTHSFPLSLSLSSVNTLSSNISLSCHVLFFLDFGADSMLDLIFFHPASASMNLRMGRSPDA